MTRQSRALAAAALTLVLSVPVGAQEPQPPTPSPTPPAAGTQTPSPTAADRPTLELSLQEAVARALDGNADIAVEKYNPQASAQDVRAAEGVYDPFFLGTVNQTSRKTPAQDVFAGNAVPDNRAFTYNLGLNQYVPTGGSATLRFNNSRNTTNSTFATFNPSYSSALTLGLSQPLFKNFKMDAARQQIKVSRTNNRISETQFRQTVINIIANVKGLYYELIFAIDNLQAQRESLSLAQKLLDENQIKVKVGTMAPLDVVAAESEVALREQNVIVAEAALYDAEDAIKRSIFPQNDPANWALRIVPKDRPTAEAVPVDIEGAVRNALEKRTDVQVARLNLENSDTRFQFFRSQALPQVDVFASYGTAGLGGTQLLGPDGQPLPQPIPGGYGDALSDVFGRDFPNWALGVNFSYAFGNRTGGAGKAQAQILREQATAALRRLELQVAQEVRSAGRAVESNFKSAAAARAARVLQERRLDAEQKRFAAGMSTNFLVTQAQRDLAFAAVQEIRAIADFRKSLVNFDRVQDAGGGVAF